MTLKMPRIEDVDDNELWVREIEGYTCGGLPEAQTAVNRFGGSVVLAFVKREGRLPEDEFDVFSSAVEAVARLFSDPVNRIGSAVGAIASAYLDQPVRSNYSRYERVQQRVVERGGRRKHNGRLGKITK